MNFFLSLRIDAKTENLSIKGTLRKSSLPVGIHRRNVGINISNERRREAARETRLIPNVGVSRYHDGISGKLFFSSFIE